MTQTIVLAWRNVFRNRRRALITASMISLSLAASLFLWAFIAGFNGQSIDSSTGYLSGHLQLASKGFFDRSGFTHLIHTPSEVEAVLARDPAVKAFAPRVEGVALLINKDESRGIALLGVDPRIEGSVTKLASVINQGRYLTPDGANEIVLSHTIAEQIGAEPGQEVVLRVETADGSPGVVKFNVVGIFNTKNHDIDGTFCLISLSAAQKLFGLGRSLTNYAIITRQRRGLDETAAKIQADFGGQYELRTWEVLLPSVAQSVAFHEVFSYMVLGIVLTLVAIGVVNTMLMSVMERTPEWGLVLALGASPLRLLNLVLLEGLFLGAIGIPVGYFLALGLIEYFSKRGIDLSKFSKGLEAFPAHSVTVYPSLTSDAVIFTIAMLLAVILLASLYPALKVFRLTPIEALRNFKQGVRNSLKHKGRISASRSKRVFLQIAWRNLARNPRRSVLISIASGVGISAMILLYALIEGFFVQIVDNSTGYYAGHLQVGSKSFYKREPSLSHLIDDPQRVQRLLTQILDSRGSFTWRVESQAILHASESAKDVRLLGIDPTREQQVTSLSRAVKDGTFLEPGDDAGIVLGRQVAGRLRVDPGMAVNVTVSAADGRLQSATFVLRGVFETGSEAFDDKLALISCTAAQQLLGSGDKVSTFIVRLKDRQDAPAVLQNISQGLAGTDLEGISWQVLLPESEQILELSKTVFAIVLGIAFGVAALGSMNSILMSVMERRKEIGTLLALGTTPVQVIRLVMYESSALVLCGALLGIITGGALSLYLGTKGIDLSAYARSVGRVPGMTSVIYPKVTVVDAGMSALILLIANTIASLYPAWKAAYLDPVQNLRNL